ncbi:MAG: hypothetical protein OEW18_06645 [Candidatus Aminicenantes bacterium]|nr:hypothetical protein [Candidatus Aminicenantes bacterium]
MERGTKSFFRLTVKVIGLEVTVFLFGTGRSAVGIPFSIFSRLAFSSAAL